MFSVKPFLPRAKRYFRENPGALFVIAFQILLLVCVGLLIVGNSVWADGLATAAYFSLVIGVVFQACAQLFFQRVFHWIRIRKIRIRTHKPKYFLRHGKQEQEKN